ncbi:hypothetical protein DMENIID0001_059830 [Sergentomyia squamirostris]
MGKENEFLKAARQGDVVVIEKYLYQKRSGPLASLRRTPPTNIQDSNGYSALHYASLNGHATVVQLLLIGDANPNIQDNRGLAPLHLAAWAGHQEIVKLLLSHTHRPAEANLLTADRDTPLHCAAQHGHTGALTTLLAHGADPTRANERGETPFDLAAQYGRLQAVQMLIRAHPDLMTPFRRPATEGVYYNHTPLHLAARNGHARVVEMLLAAGMDVNVVTGGGSALHEAALCGKDAVVKILLASGADLGITDSSGRTPIDLLEEFPPHVTRRIVKVINNFQNDLWKQPDNMRRPRSCSPSSPILRASSSLAPPPKKPPRRNLSVSPTNMSDVKFLQEDLFMRDYDTSRKLKRWRHSQFIESCIIAARCPLSPTNYLQPPTPEHAPPSVNVAENAIYQHMQPLRRVIWRRNVKLCDVATAPDPGVTASLSSCSSSDSEDSLFRGTLVHMQTSHCDNEKSRTCITHQRFDVIDRERLGVGDSNNHVTETSETSLDDNNCSETQIDTKSIDVRGLLEKKEWRDLSKSIETFGDDDGSDTMNAQEAEMAQMLVSLKLEHTMHKLIDKGFDNISFIPYTLHRGDLADCLTDGEFDRLIKHLVTESSPFDILDEHDGSERIFSIEEWLKGIQLEQYLETFKRHLVTRWERLSGIWESELESLLEIDKIGHRRRILASIEWLKSKKINQNGGIHCMEALEMRNPGNSVGVQWKNGDGGVKWRHTPSMLVTKPITYHVIHLGGTFIDSGLNAPAAIHQSIVQLKHNAAKKISLRISYGGIELTTLDSSDNNPETIREHRIKDIAFVCQDAEDLTYFAYITTEEQQQQCQVFRTLSTDLATEIILTIGQCFEIAYQMALYDDGPQDI